jgi:hydrogenase/urease accessory protein HupE
VVVMRVPAVGLLGATRARVASVLFCATLSLSARAHADVFRPAYLELRQQTADTYMVLWKVPAQGDMRMSLYVRMPAGTQAVSTRRSERSGDAYAERWTIRHPHLEGTTIAIDGLRASSADVLVRVARLDGTEQVVRLLPAETSFVVRAAPGAYEVALTYLRLGIQHILTGADHLLFVLALLLIVRAGKRLVWTISAFTLAHSITLACATLGWVQLPGPPVEASIALSIVFLAREIVMSARGEAGLTERFPWLIAFLFGLLHGLGFARALTEVGLPQAAIPLALVCFNFGVECGQLLFVAAVLICVASLRRFRPASGAVTRMATTYAIGSVAAYWVIERVSGFWS